MEFFYKNIVKPVYFVILLRLFGLSYSSFFHSKANLRSFKLDFDIPRIWSVGFVQREQTAKANPLVMGTVLNAQIRKPSLGRKNAFLSERYRISEAIEDMKSTQALKKTSILQTKFGT